MLYEHMDLLESIGLDLLFAAIFFLYWHGHKRCPEAGQCATIWTQDCLAGPIFRMRRFCDQGPYSAQLGRCWPRLILGTGHQQAEHETKPNHEIG